MFEHDRLVLVSDLDDGWRELGRFAVNLNRYVCRCHKTNVFSLAYAFAISTDSYKFRLCKSNK